MQKKDNIKRSRVLFVEENQDGTIGGSYFSLLDLIREFDKNMIDKYVMFYSDHQLVSSYKESGGYVTIFHKPVPVNFSRFDNMIIFSGVLRFFLVFMQKAYNAMLVTMPSVFYFIYFIIQYKIDVIHLNNSIFAGFEWVLAAKLTGKKIVTHHREYFSSIPKGCGVHCNWFDFIFGISNSVKVNLDKIGVKLTDSNYSTIYNKIDFVHFKNSISKSPMEIRSEFCIGDEKIPLIGIVGNIQPWKGQLYVVEALRLVANKIPDVKCLLIGAVSTTSIADQAYHFEIMNKIKQYGLEKNAVVTGYRNDISSIMNALDVLIHNSTDPEPFGRVVLEGMALSKAIIAARLGGPLEMIEDGVNGLLVDPTNPEEISEKILWLLSHEDNRLKFGERAFETVKSKFSKIDINKILHIYNKHASN